jgi:hypothetical protein
MPTGFYFGFFRVCQHIIETGKKGLDLILIYDSLSGHIGTAEELLKPDVFAVKYILIVQVHQNDLIYIQS